MRLGFVGLGVQGMPIAENICGSEHELTVYDALPSPVQALVGQGASAASSLAGLARASEIMMVCVRDDAQVIEVCLDDHGLVAAGNSGAILVIHSTVSVNTIKRVHEAASERGISVVDAGVSGGFNGARNQTMSFMVGGDTAAVEACVPIFRLSGSKITHVGEVGTGMSAKLAHQVVLCINVMAAFEGVRIGREAGIAPETLMKVFHEGGAQSHIADRWFKHTMGSYALDLWDKDLRLAIELAEQLGITVEAAAMARARIREISPPSTRAPVEIESAR